jgi:uncharacterized protein YbjT (DUF2867 family)
MPSAAAQRAFAAAFADGLVFCFPKQGHSLARDFKWTGSHRFGIVHLGGRDRADLRQRADRASALLGWPSPYALEPSGAAAGSAHTANQPAAGRAPIVA